MILFVDRYREEVSHSQERECDQECGYRWEGEGNDKRWVVDTSTCSCGHVTRETRVKVPYYDCKLIKRNECRWVSAQSLQSNMIFRLSDQFRWLSVARFLTESARLIRGRCVLRDPRLSVKIFTRRFLTLSDARNQSRCAVMIQRIVMINMFLMSSLIFYQK